MRGLGITQPQLTVAKTCCVECRPHVVELLMFSQKPKSWILFKIPQYKKITREPNFKKRSLSASILNVVLSEATLGFIF